MFYKVGLSVLRTTVQALLLLGSDLGRDENHSESSAHERRNETFHGSWKLKSAETTVAFDNLLTKERKNIIYVLLTTSNSTDNIMT